MGEATAGYETTKYIKEHPKAYQNANMTVTFPPVAPVCC